MIERVKHKEVECPTKVHELLKIALTDLEKAEKHEKYIVNMETWHEGAIRHPDDSNKVIARCSVCQAGAVMAFTLDISIDESLYGCRRFEYKWVRALLALNCFRSHSLRNAEYEFTGFDKLNKLPSEKYSSYETSPEQYKKWAWAMQKAYEEENL